MNVGQYGRLILVALFLRVTIAEPQASFGVGPRGSHNVTANAGGTAQTQPSQSRVIVADQQSGSDMGAKIAAANLALGSGKGEIRVGKSGELSEPIVLSQNHDLVCVDNQVTLTLSKAQAKITQGSNTRISGCTFASTQTVSGVAVFSQGTSNIQVEDVTFAGGGYHILYNTVSNFNIKNTRHLSITAKGASPILIGSSAHGQIISPRITGFIVPAGNSGIRLIGIKQSSFINVENPIIQGVDASTVPGCGGLTFTASNNSGVHGGVISGLNNCDGVLTESIERTPSNDIEINGTVSTGHNNSPGHGKNTNNGEGFDIFNSKNVRLVGVTANNNGKSPSNHQPGIEVSNSSDVTISKCIVSDNGVEGIKVDGSPAVTISESQVNRNGGVGILVMPALGGVSATNRSPIVDWAPAGPNVTFSAVWPARTKIAIGGTVYTISSFLSPSKLTLTADFAGATGKYSYSVDSYVDITGGEALDNGQLSAGLPPDRNAGQREGVYFAGGASGEITGHVTGLHAADTQGRKTQTYGIRVENQARIVAEHNSVTGNLVGGIQDSPRKSTIH